MEQKSGLTKEDIAILVAKFPEEKLGVKVNSFSKDRTRAMLVLYLQHTDVYERIEMVDPSWQSMVTHTHKLEDVIFVSMTMTIKGVTRENVGEGQDYKAAYSDALKRCAMLFGVGRYLYDIETIWVPYNESTDRFKTWQVSDFREAFKSQRKK